MSASTLLAQAVGRAQRRLVGAGGSTQSLTYLQAACRFYLATRRASALCTFRRTLATPALQMQVQMQVQIFPSGCALKPSYANPTATSLAVIHPTNVSLDAVATSGETTTAMYSSNLGVERSSECHNRRAIVRSCALCLHQRGALCRAARYRLRPSRAFVYRWSHPRSLKQVLYVCDSKCRLSLAASGECRASSCRSRGRQLHVGDEG